MSAKGILEEALPFIEAQRVMLKNARDPRERDARQLISKIKKELAKKPRKAAKKKATKKSTKKAAKKKSTKK